MDFPSLDSSSIESLSQNIPLSLIQAASGLRHFNLLMHCNYVDVQLQLWELDVENPPPFHSWAHTTHSIVLSHFEWNILPKILASETLEYDLGFEYHDQSQNFRLPYAYPRSSHCDHWRTQIQIVREFVVKSSNHHASRFHFDNYWCA